MDCRLDEPPRGDNDDDVRRGFSGDCGGEDLTGLARGFERGGEVGIVPALTERLRLLDTMRERVEGGEVEVRKGDEGRCVNLDDGGEVGAGEPDRLKGV
jgi:hypothetical protein